MGKPFDIQAIHERGAFPDGPIDIPIGSMLQNGHLPGDVRAGYAYAHVEAVVDGEVVPSSTDAVHPLTGAVHLPGEVALMDTRVVPPEFTRFVGRYTMSGGAVQFERF